MYAGSAGRVGSTNGVNNLLEGRFECWQFLLFGELRMYPEAYIVLLNLINAQVVQQVLKLVGGAQGVATRLGSNGCKKPRLMADYKLTVFGHRQV